MLSCENLIGSGNSLGISSMATCNAEFGERGHDRGVKAGDGFSGQGKLPRRAVAGRNPQDMIDEVEIDLKVAHAVRDRRGRQPARGDIERDMPGMVQPGRAHKTNLADDLGPQMQRFVGVAPGRGRQFRPGRFQRTRDFMRIAHAPPYTLSSTFSSNTSRPGTIRPGLYISNFCGIGDACCHRAFGGLCAGSGVSNQEWVLSGHPRRPREARNRLRQYQRRAIASSGLRAS